MLFTVRWRPTLQFSFGRLRGLFSYSWKLLVSEIINTGYNELRGVVIGFRYSANDLAYYNKGQSFPKLVVDNVNTSLRSVLFPQMSNCQDRRQEVKDIARKAVRISGYVIMPLTLGLGFVAEPLIKFLLTEKWLPCVPFMQLYCIYYLFIPIQTVGLIVMKALGRSDTYLKIEIIKKVVGIAVLIVTIPFGVLAIAIGAVAASIFAALINVVPTKRFLSYTYKEQFYDFFHGIIPLVLMSLTCIALSFLPAPDLVIVCAQVLAGAAVYILVSWILKLEAFMYVYHILMRVLKRRSAR